MRQLGQAVFEAPVRGWRLFEELLASFRQAKGQPAPVVGIGASVDLPGPDQDVYGAADCGFPSPNLRRDLLERRGSMHLHRLEEISLLTEPSCGNRISAKLLDESGEPFGETDW